MHGVATCCGGGLREEENEEEEVEHQEKEHQEKEHQEKEHQEKELCVTWNWRPESCML